MFISLPIDTRLGDIVTRLREYRNVVLTATPGAGKTTRLPPELLKAVNGKVIVLEPRRMAAVAACHRVCEENGWTVGQEAGYQVRFESKISAQTRLIFMTDALLLRQIVDNPELNGIDLVVIDEFHERGLNQDLILGIVKELQELGRDIKLLVMSATLDIRRLSAFLDNSTAVDVPGQTFPLDLRHWDANQRLQTDHTFYDRLVAAVREADRATAGDVLVFLPGVGEINRLRDRLGEIVKRDIEVLHGSLSLKEQQRVLRAPERPRVILSTNVAEASVTVNGVDWVIDSGLAKVMNTHPRTGFSQLELSRISQFNARQRAGRAARQKPGTCVRLWSAFEDATMVKEPVPECQRADLAQALLVLAHLGVNEFTSFSWYDPPPAPLMLAAMRSLKWMGALDEQHRLTEFGQKLLRYPLPPRWGALLALGEQRGWGRLAARMAALLGDRDVLDNERARTAAPSLHECDVTYRLELLSEMERGRTPGVVHARAAQTVLEAAKQLERLVRPGGGDVDEGAVRELLLLSQRDRLCRRRGKSERALMVGGRGVRLASESQVRGSDFFVALQGIDLPNQVDTSISVACGFSKEFVLSKLADLVRVREDVWYDEDKEQFFTRRARSIEDLPVEEPVLMPLSDPGEHMIPLIVERWDKIAGQHEGLKAWYERFAFLCAHKPELKSLVTIEHIRKVAEMAGYGRARLSEVLAQDLPSYLESTLDAQLVRDLKTEVPAYFTAPSGQRHPVHYGEGHSAFVEVRLQEMFGQPTTPKIVYGQVPITFRLLGPNFRPVQVTSDLASFWKSGYAEVRKELRARYPKHAWPEDPLTAKPEAKGRRRPI